MAIADKLQHIKNSIPESVKLVVITKTQPADTIMKVYETGHRVFGENKVQELVNKYEQLPRDMEWHMVGHLQSNKVKYIAPFVHLVHSVDSMKLLRVIDQEGLKNHKVISCLLQIKIAREKTKYGLSEHEAVSLLEDQKIRELKNIKITGLMGMATYTSDLELVRSEFRNLNTIFNMFQKKYFNESPEFKELSMGMSHDYPIAIEEGATYIRIGTSIFGERITK